MSEILTSTRQPSRFDLNKKAHNGEIRVAFRTVHNELICNPAFDPFSRLDSTRFYYVRMTTRRWSADKKAASVMQIFIRRMPSKDFFLCRLCEKLSEKNRFSLRQFSPSGVALVSTTRAAAVPTRRGENDVLPPGGVHSLHKHIIKP